MLNKGIGRTPRQYKVFRKWFKQGDTSKKKLKLLEIGAGDMILKRFIPQNIIYHSMDFGSENNPTLKSTNKYKYLFDLDKGKMPIKNDTYDIIICFETLEHTKYPKGVLREIKRIAKNNAILFFSMPNEYNFVQRIYYFFGKKTYCDEPFEIVEKHLHIHRPRVKDIIKLFKDVFEIKEIEYVWQSNKLPAFLDRIINLKAQILPSLFARTVVIMATNRK